MVFQIDFSLITNQAPDWDKLWDDRAELEFAVFEEGYQNGFCLGVYDGQLVFPPGGARIQLYQDVTMT